MLILTREDVRAVVSMQDAIGVLEQTFRELGAGEAIMPTRIAMEAQEANGFMLAMPAYLKRTGALGVKVVSSYPDNPRTVGMPTIQAVILYYDGATGERLALMEGTYLTALRTGATSGLATKYLANADSHVAGVIGSGAQAETQLEAVCSVRKITGARVYSLTPAHAASFAERMSSRVGIEVRPVSEAKEAVEGCSIVITATSSKIPVLSGHWLTPGTHINAVGSHTAGARELDADTIRKSKVVVDSWAAASQEAGDLLIPIAEGLIAKTHVYGELADLAMGRKPGRSSPREITVFKSVGLAIEDVAVAKLVYERGKASGIGLEVTM
jgi:ornithine cyclodeaminase/alanine dehydrogenase